MILSNTEIQRALDEGRIVLNPSPDPPFDTTAIDLRLGDLIQVPKTDKKDAFIDPQSDSIINTLNYLYYKEKIREHYLLEPNKFILSKTFESVSLPSLPDENGYYLAARVEGKSSLARCGLLIHFTAPTIHAGFEGTITLEIINLGAFPIKLRSKMLICQLIFETVLGKPYENPSEFQGQSNPDGSK